MKKALSILGILAIVGVLGTPALAAPMHGGHHMGGPMHGHVKHSHHRPMHTPPPRIHHHHYNNGYISVGGVLARHNYWHNYYGCNCQLGWNHHYRHCPYFRNSAYINVGIPIRF